MPGFPPAAVSRRRVLVGGVAAVTAVAGSGLLAACGPGAGAPAAQARGGRLRVVLGGRSAATDVLDPHVAGSSAGGALSKNVWDHLVAYENDLTLRYRLATALEPNADGTQWRIVLREGVRFSDGTPFTSRDVLWSIRRMLDPTRPSSGDLSMVDIARTRADGDHAVVVALTEPLADFGSVLAGWYVYVVKDGSDVFDATTMPPGTGPFRLVSWSPGDRAVLARHDGHWGGAPLLDEVELIQVSETEARMNAFLSGEAEVVHELSALQARAATGRPDVTLLAPPFGKMSAFQMRVDRAPFDDARVRAAMRLAIDRQDVVEKIHLGFGELGNDLYGKGAPFYAGDLPQRRYDPAAARALLQQAGTADLRVTLHVSDASPGVIDTATLFKEHAEAAGITIDLAVTPADTYFATVAGKEAFTYTGWWNYSLDYYYGQTTVSTAPDNGTGWQRPAWDATFRQARGTLDRATRTALYHELQQQLWDEGGYIVHSFAAIPDGVRSTVHGMPKGVPGTDDWANYGAAWIEA